jgi:hypothetical protein
MMVACHEPFISGSVLSLGSTYGTTWDGLADGFRMNLHVGSH